MGKYSNKYQSISKSDILEWPSVLEDSLTAKQKEVYINRKQLLLRILNETKRLIIFVQGMELKNLKSIARIIHS